MKWITNVYHASKHLTTNELLPQLCKCAWCHSNSLSCIGPVQREPVVDLCECGHCHAVSVSRMPMPEALNQYYGSYYTHTPEKSPKTNVTIGNPSRMAVRLAGVLRLGSTRPRGIRVLDFGGGDGTLAILTAAELLLDNAISQAEIFVIDSGSEARDSSDERIVVRKQSDILREDEGSYDLVIASAVLEHIPEAPTVLERLLDQVKPGGMLYIRTPATSSFIKIAESVGLHWDFTFPAHVYDLGQLFWEKYFGSEPKKRLFNVVFSRPSIVEASFSHSPIRAGLSWLFKAPWYLLGSRWQFVGGWELAVMRRRGA
jgi:SAM-dependent methyltransferase